MSDSGSARLVLVLFRGGRVRRERIVRSVGAGSNQAINQRLDLIGRGVSRGEAMQLCAPASNFRKACRLLARPAIAFEKTLMAAGIAMPTGG
jgi:hypothetical protein